MATPTALAPAPHATRLVAARPVHADATTRDQHAGLPRLLTHRAEHLRRRRIRIGCAGNVKTSTAHGDIAPFAAQGCWSARQPAATPVADWTAWRPIPVIRRRSCSWTAPGARRSCRHIGAGRMCCIWTWPRTRRDRQAITAGAPRYAEPQFPPSPPAVRRWSCIGGPAPDTDAPRSTDARPRIAR